MDYSPPGCSIHGVLQVRILVWVTISSSRGSFPPRDQIWVSCIDRRVLYHWATREVLCTNTWVVLKNHTKIVILIDEINANINSNHYARFLEYVSCFGDHSNWSRPRVSPVTMQRGHKTLWSISLVFRIILCSLLYSQLLACLMLGVTAFSSCHFILQLYKFWWY